MTPIQSAEALGCSQVKTMIKSVSADISFADSKGAKKMVDAYKIAFTNPKCISTKELRDMKKAASDIIKMCNDPKSFQAMQGIFGKNLWTDFCKGFQGLAKYTK